MSVRPPSRVILVFYAPFSPPRIRLESCVFIGRGPSRRVRLLRFSGVSVIHSHSLIWTFLRLHPFLLVVIGTFALLSLMMGVILRVRRRHFRIWLPRDVSGWGPSTTVASKSISFWAWTMRRHGPYFDLHTEEYLGQPTTCLEGWDLRCCSRDGRLLWHPAVLSSGSRSEWFEHCTLSFSA